MASAMKNLRMDNDSVVYEHIIPRTARQKWVRRTSGDFTGLKVDVRQQNIGIDNEFMESIVSHDIQDDGKQMVNNDLDHLGPQEEIAVFNAWGIKLRHINKWKEPLSRNSEIQKQNYAKLDDRSKECNVNIDKSIDNHLLSSQLETKSNKITGKTMNDSSTSDYSIKATQNSSKVKEASLKVKRQRPKSMPDMMPESVLVNTALNNYKQTPPKAYKSPHSKVPWKRSIDASKPIDKSPDKDKDLERLGTYLESNHVDVNNEGKNAKPDNMASKRVENTKTERLNGVQCKQPLSVRVENADTEKVNGVKGKQALSVRVENADTERVNGVKGKQALSVTVENTLTEKLNGVQGKQPLSVRVENTDTEKLNGIEGKQPSSVQGREEIAADKDDVPVSVLERTKSFEKLDVRDNINHQLKNIHHGASHYKSSDNDKMKKEAQTVLKKLTDEKDEKSTIGLKENFAGQEFASTTANAKEKPRMDNIVKKNPHIPTPQGVQNVANHAHDTKGMHFPIHKYQEDKLKAIANIDNGVDENHAAENEPGSRIKEVDCHKSPKVFQASTKIKRSKKKDDVSPNILPNDVVTKDAGVSDKSEKEREIKCDSVPVTTIKAPNRRVGKMLIQSGDMRERQVKANKENNNVSCDNNNIAILKNIKESNAATKISNKEEPCLQQDVPITNIDDIANPKTVEKVHIPVTNLDEMISPIKMKKSSLNLECNKFNEEKSSTLHFCPIKKVDYNEGRDLITPKIICEKPVGLKSSLSPKERKHPKVLRVSFSTDKLEKLHMYPSETAATEMYDEANVEELKSSSANCDSFLNIDHSEDLASYKSNCWTNLEETIERERKKFSTELAEAGKSNEASVVSTDIEPNFGGGDHFTESTLSTASAILF